MGIMSEEQELPPITITTDDIREANQLSLHCPICANPVENYVQEADLQAVVCAKCGTLYHKSCWQLGGNKCAILGCNHEKYYVHGVRVSPVLSIKHSDLAPAVPTRNGSRSAERNKQLKHEQRRQVERMRRPGIWQRLWQWLLDQIKIG